VVAQAPLYGAPKFLSEGVIRNATRFPVSSFQLGPFSQVQTFILRQNVSIGSENRMLASSGSALKPP
jgi:hypothetical protein